MLTAWQTTTGALPDPSRRTRVDRTACLWAPGSEAKRFNEEVMGSRNVLVYEDWNDAFDLWHVWLLQPWFVLV
jgi:hypothetical protein